MQVDESGLTRFEKQLKKPRTVQELIDATGLSRRTVFRYLQLLQERGINVVRANIGRPTRYQVQ